MENNKRFKTVYKLRFLPLIVTSIILAIVSLLKYTFEIEVGRIFGWSIFLVVASFIYYRGVIQTKNEKEKEEELAKNPPPPPTKEEAQQIYENEMQAAVSQQETNIVFRCFYLFIGLLTTLGGLNLILFNKEYLFGSIVFVGGILFIIHSIFVLRKWITYRKIFKEEKKKKIFENEADNTL